MQMYNPACADLYVQQVDMYIQLFGMYTIGCIPACACLVCTVAMINNIIKVKYVMYNYT